jgi:hypothetical protein
MPRSTSPIGSTLRAVTHSRVVRGGACAVALACGLVATARASTAPGPAIYSVSATPRVAHAGDAVKWDAHVSPDVVSVTARVAVYTFSLYPVRYCHFGEAFRIPKDVPAFFHGKYSVTVTATNAKGESASRSIALRFE